MKLGRRAIKRDSRTLRLSNYLNHKLPPPPLARDWTHGVTDWGMMCNDTLGCCTIAAIGHAIQVLTLNSGTEITLPDATILSYYEKFCGYNPADPSTDQGGIELDVLNDFKQQGFAGHQLLAFAGARTAGGEIRQAIDLFGGVYIGIALPASAQQQVGSLWTVVDGPGSDAGSWGGHAVFVPAYDQHTLTCITWGRLQKMTWEFWYHYVDEVYALLSPDFIAANGVDPAGFNLDQLKADLALIH